LEGGEVLESAPTVGVREVVETSEMLDRRSLSRRAD
jgi:hypothetical protein